MKKDRRDCHWNIYQRTIKIGLAGVILTRRFDDFLETLGTTEKWRLSKENRPTVVKLSEMQMCVFGSRNIFLETPFVRPSILEFALSANDCFNGNLFFVGRQNNTIEITWNLRTSFSWNELVFFFRFISVLQMYENVLFFTLWIFGRF